MSRLSIKNKYFKGDIMSKAISSYPESEKAGVISRRLKNKAGGIGTLAAQDAIEAQKKPRVKKEEK